MLWNIPFVHRSFIHTFTSEATLFIPLKNVCYVSRNDISEGWFEAQVLPRYTDKRSLRNLPPSFECFVYNGVTYIRSIECFEWYKGRLTTHKLKSALKRLGQFHSAIRKDIVPISGIGDLWYLRKPFKNNSVAEHNTLTIVFAAMHRLSELSRYDPEGFERHLGGRANWLITEFIEHAPIQFIDQISSEITGLQFWRPGIRT